jgi:alkylated DNA repair dioxygenase AlkB
LPVDSQLQPFLDWAHSAVDAQLNGILVNWYDGGLRHYIGRHRDSTANLVVGAPIVTISLGEERVFRLRPWKGKGIIDFPAANGMVFVLPYETNLHWTHEVTHRTRDIGRRISVTLRAFS